MGIFKQMHEEEKMKKNKSRQQDSDISKAIIIPLVILFLLIVAMIVCQSVKYHTLQGELRDLQQQTANNAQSLTDYEKFIEHIGSETTQYREFMQQQQGFILWLVALVGAVGAAILGFFGFKSRREMRKDIEKKFEDDFAGELARLIQNNDKLEFLARGAQREQMAQRKRILFAVRESEDDIKDLDIQRKYFEDVGFRVSERVVSLKDDSSLYKNIQEYDIVVYQVPDKKDAIYKELDKIEEKDCVLICLNGIRLEPSPKFATTVNFYPKLRETLYTLLYFYP